MFWILTYEHNLNRLEEMLLNKVVPWAPFVIIYCNYSSVKKLRMCLPVFFYVLFRIPMTKNADQNKIQKCQLINNKFKKKNGTKINDAGLSSFIRIKQ